jgi:hypothetical protein
MYLNIKNRAGSVQHYYHFLLGFLLPLVEWYALRRDDLPKKVRIRSCAILDPIICELSLPGLEIVSKEELIDVIESALALRKPASTVDEARGYDDSWYYDGPKLRRLARLIENRLSNEIGMHRRSIFNEEDPRVDEILIINRKESDPFYFSQESEFIDSGVGRRSIPNFSELVDGLRASGLKVRSVYLEDMPLAYQVALFSNASCIIAQHGAALANLVFAKKGTRLIEVKPSDLRVKLKDCFTNLSAELGIGYQSVHQEGSHGMVNLDALLQTYHEGAAWHKEFQVLEPIEVTQRIETTGSSFYSGKIQGIFDGVPLKTETKILARIWNLSTSDWYSEGESSVRVTYHWYRQDGTVLVMNGLRSQFPDGVLKSGGIVDLPVLVSPPEEGWEYRLELTLVREKILWFEQSNEFQSHVFPVTVLGNSRSGKF